MYVFNLCNKYYWTKKKQTFQIFFLEIIEQFKEQFEPCLKI